MSSTPAKMLVFVSSQLACIKIQGKANFTTSIDFKTLINELLDKGFTCVVLDLAECSLMDSTFLGVLAGYGMKLKGTSETSPHPIELMNPTPRILELLEGLGVLHLFHMIRTVTGQGELKEMEYITANGTPSREEITMNCLEAHKLLMEINPQNYDRFKDVAQFLSEDLKRIQSVK